MSFLLTQDASNTTGGTTVSTFTVAFPANNAAGNFLVMVTREPAGAGNTYLVTDSQSNSWLKVMTWTNGSEQYEMFYVKSCKVGANTVSATINGVSTFFYRAIIAEFSGFTVSGNLDQSGNAIAAIANPNPVSAFISASQATELLIGFYANFTADGVSPSADASWTKITDRDGNLTAFYKALPVSPPTSWAATMTSASSQNYAGSITALQAASSGTAIPALVRQYAFTQGSGSGATSVTSAATALTAGDVAIITAFWNDQSKTVTSVTDTAGNTWVAVPNTLKLVPSVGIFAIQTWRSVLTNSSGSATITVNFSGSTPFPALEGAEFSNIDTTTPVQTSAGSATSGIPTSSSISPTGNLVLWGSFFTNNGNKNASVDWNQVVNANNGYNMDMYQIILTGKYNIAGEVSQNVNWGAGIAGFMNLILNSNLLMMMGCGT